MITRETTGATNQKGGSASRSEPKFGPESNADLWSSTSQHSIKLGKSESLKSRQTEILQNFSHS